VSALTQRSRRRQGLDADGMTLPEIARELGITRQAANQLLLKALAKARRALLRRGLSPKIV
jgi:DNA-directed RNA polymerase sigma subunit (sigma70/sigma32)